MLNTVATEKFLGYPTKDAAGKVVKYRWETYNEAYIKAKAIAAFLKEIGCKTGDRIGLYMPNCPEWVIAEQACLMLNLITVPLSNSCKKKDLRAIVSETEMEVLFVSPKHVASDGNLYKITQLGIKCVKYLVLVEDHWTKDHVYSKPEVAPFDYDLNIRYFNDLLKNSSNDLIPSTANPEETYTICYTSGTTGAPLSETGQFMNLSEKDVCFSYLPLAHIFERSVSHTAISYGASIGYSSGNITNFSGEIQLVKPTLLAAVPRVLEDIRNKTFTTVNSRNFMLRDIFNLDRQEKVHNNFVGRTLDWVIFRKIHRSLGDHVRGILVGGAKLDPELLKWARMVFGDVYEGYGQTEAHGAITLTQKGELKTGIVGGPLPCIEFKLENALEIEYGTFKYPAPDSGQVLVRGPCVFSGYYKKNQDTKATIDSDGWVRTGDIGKIDLATGALSIIDRVKSLIKLDNGEYVSPEKIEPILKEKIPNLIEEIFVTGSVVGNNKALVAIVYTKLREDQNPYAVYEAGLASLEKEKALSSIERPTAVHFVFDPFPETAYTDLGKPKRYVLEEIFKEAIVKLSNNIN